VASAVVKTLVVAALLLAAAITFRLLRFTTGGKSETFMLRLEGLSAAEGSTLTVPISLFTNGGAPAAVQWTITYSAAQVGEIAVAPGPVAAAAGKSIDCVSREPGEHRCIVSGMNYAGIGDGILAIVSIVLAEGRTGGVSLRLTGTIAVSPEGRAIAAAGGDSSLTIAP
jgi:hypothetical protein